MDINIGNVCMVNNIPCIIYDIEDFEIDIHDGVIVEEHFLYNAITFDGNKMITNCPVFVAENLNDYIEQLVLKGVIKLEPFDPDEIMR